MAKALWERASRAAATIIFLSNGEPNLRKEVCVSLETESFGHRESGTLP